MNYHPDIELLLKYSNGSIEPALSVAIGLHQKQCPECQQQIADLESIGGQNLELMTSSSIKQNSFDRLVADLDKLPQSKELIVQKTNTDLHASNVVATNLTEDDSFYYAIAESDKPYFDQLARFKHDDFEWQKVTSKISSTEVELGDPRFKVEILSFSPHAKIPKHTHLGNEFTLVIQGDFKDQRGEYSVGEFIACDASDEHQPVAGHSGCVCLAITDAPLNFTGLLGPFINWFVRH